MTSRARTAAAWAARRYWVWLWAVTISAAIWWGWPAGLPWRGATVTATFTLCTVLGLAGAALQPKAGFTTTTALLSLTAAAVLFAAALTTPMCIDDTNTSTNCTPGQAAEWSVVALTGGLAVLVIRMPATLWRTLRRGRRRQEPAP